MLKFKYAKPVAQIVATVLGGLGALVASGGVLGWAELVNLLILGVTALGVYVKSNTISFPYAKSVVAVAGAVLAVLASAFLTGGLTAPVVVQIVLAALGALGVYGVEGTELEPGGLSPARV